MGGFLIVCVSFFTPYLVVTLFAVWLLLVVVDGFSSDVTPTLRAIDVEIVPMWRVF